MACTSSCSAGLKSHGPGAHDYPYWLDSWSKLLTEHGAVVDGALSFPSQEQLDHSDVVIIYKGDAGYMTPEQRARLAGLCEARRRSGHLP